MQEMLAQEGIKEDTEECFKLRAKEEVKKTSENEESR